MSRQQVNWIKMDLIAGAGVNLILDNQISNFLKWKNPSKITCSVLCKNYITHFVFLYISYASCRCQNHRRKDFVDQVVSSARRRGNYDKPHLLHVYNVKNITKSFQICCVTLCLDAVANYPSLSSKCQDVNSSSFILSPYNVHSIRFNRHQ